MSRIQATYLYADVGVESSWCERGWAKVCSGKLGSAKHWSRYGAASRRGYDDQCRRRFVEPEDRAYLVKYSWRVVGRCRMEGKGYVGLPLPNDVSAKVE